MDLLFNRKFRSVDSKIIRRFINLIVDNKYVKNLLNDKKHIIYSLIQYAIVR